MYVSSLYGPVYLVSHIVPMYIMPELGMIIALGSSRKSGFQTFMHPEYSSSDNNCACYHFCQSRWYSKTPLNMQMVASLMCSCKVTIWFELCSLHFRWFIIYFFIILSQLCINVYSSVLFPVLCLVDSSFVSIILPG